MSHMRSITRSIARWYRSPNEPTMRARSSAASTCRVPRRHHVLTSERSFVSARSVHVCGADGQRAWMANGTEAEYCAWTATMARMAASGSWNGCEMPLRASAKSTACRAVMCNAAGFTRPLGAGRNSVHTHCKRSTVVGLSSFLQSHDCLVSIPDDAPASRQLMRHTRRDTRKAGADARPPDNRTKDM